MIYEKIQVVLMCMETGSGIHNIDKEYFLTISKLTLKIIETNNIGDEIVNSYPIRGSVERTLSCSEKAWKDIGWESKKSIDYRLEGM